MLPHIPLVRSTNAQHRQSDGCGKHLFVLLQSRDNLPSFSVRTSTALKIVDVAQGYPALCARWNPSSFPGDCRSCSENRWMPCWLVGGRNWAFVQMPRGPLGIRIFYMGSRRYIMDSPDTQRGNRPSMQLSSHKNAIQSCLCQILVELSQATMKRAMPSSSPTVPFPWLQPRLSATSRCYTRRISSQHQMIHGRTQC